MSNPKISIRVVQQQNRDNITEFKFTAYRQFGNPEPLAFCDLKVGCSFLILHSVIVSSTHRRMGVGIRLVKHVMDYVWKTWPGRTTYISALTYGTNPIKQEDLFKFYERLGFVRTPNHPFELTITL